MRFKDLFLELSNGVLPVSVDLGARWTATSCWAGGTHLEDLLLQCLYRYLHYGPEQTRSITRRDIMRNHKTSRHTAGCPGYRPACGKGARAARD